jgi:hypothetical protein
MNETLAVAVIGVLGVLSLTVATGVIVQLIAEEVSGWLPIWSRALLSGAIKRLPAAQRDRYRDEWLAELSAYRGRPLGGALFAWRLRRRANSLSEAILDEEDLGQFPELNPFPHLKPLTPEAIAEIVRRVVERSRPEDLRSSRQIINSIRSSLEELEVAAPLKFFLARYLRDVDPAWPSLLNHRQDKEAEDFGFDEDGLAKDLERMARWVDRERRRRFFSED